MTRREMSICSLFTDTNRLLHLAIVTAALVLCPTRTCPAQEESREAAEQPASTAQPEQESTDSPDVADSPDEASKVFSLDDIWTREKLTGDWGGLRTDLAATGVTLDLRLSQYYVGVAAGGRSTNYSYGGTLDYRLNIDATKLLGLWEGLSFNMHARTRFGRDVNADVGEFALHNAGLLMPAPGNYHQTDITGLIVSQNFSLFGKPANFMIGKLDVIDTVTLFFPQVGFGQEGFSNVNGLISALPWFGAVQGLSLYGGWLVTINPEYQMGETGVLVTGTRNVATDWGSLSSSFEDGVWVAGFHRFFWKLDQKPGYFMVFGGYSSKDQASNDPHDFVNKPGAGIQSTNEEQPWDIALYVYQEFWQAEDNPDRKATLFVGATIGPDDPQFGHWHVFGAVEAYGPMASRPKDRMGVSGWYNSLSDNYKELVSPLADLQDLWGVELYYNLEITPSVHLTPNLQLISNEWEDDDFAIVTGLRLVMDF